MSDAPLSSLSTSSTLVFLFSLSPPETLFLVSPPVSLLCLLLAAGSGASRLFVGTLLFGRSPVSRSGASPLALGGEFTVLERRLGSSAKGAAKRALFGVRPVSFGNAALILSFIRFSWWIWEDRFGMADFETLGMSGAPKIRSLNVADSESRPVLVPGGNKARSLATARKLASKPLNKTETTEIVAADEKKKSPRPAADMPHFRSSFSAPSVLRRHEMLLQSNLSLNASCSSDASTDSFCSRASTGRIGRTSLTSKRRQSVTRTGKILVKSDNNLSDDSTMSSPELVHGKKKCPWVTSKTEPCYASFHDEEWGVPVHDDKKLFEHLVLSGALAELTWPIILSKRHIFREVFMDFDPVAVSKLNEKKIVVPGSAASSLLSEPKLRAIIENARQILKIIAEFGSFDRYCWSFVNHKPIVSKFRYPRQVPVKTPKADVISKDLVRRGFRSVGPTVIYSFMQATGLTNDHLISCFRFEECIAAASPGTGEADEAKGKHHTKVEEKSTTGPELMLGIDLELSRAVDELNIS
ncbi:hypothetical protein Cni_G14277 [Canna indica]|uniref:DNA glycosylase superfamily protein n=1 Tax=Canna indica TaxID=4628 RepID=A0AAQ3QDT9_9LILI|nr:hypothetical protein Cni_G14277 [Canna indica]